jgi:hypothetical protein
MTIGTTEFANKALLIEWLHEKYADAVDKVWSDIISSLEKCETEDDIVKAFKAEFRSIQYNKANAYREWVIKEQEEDVYDDEEIASAEEYWDEWCNTQMRWETLMEEIGLPYPKD